MANTYNHNKPAFLTSVAWSWAGYISTVVIAFLLSPFLIRHLGDTQYGIWALVEHTVTFLLLLEFGVGASVVRYVAKFEQIEDSEKLNRIFSASVCIFSAAGLLVLLISLAVAFFTQHPLGVPDEQAALTRRLIVVLGANAALTLPLGVFPSVLYGLGRFPAKTMIEAATRILTAIAFVVAILMGGGLLSLAMLIVAATLLKSLLAAAMTWHYLPGLRFSVKSVDRATIGLVRGYSIPAFVILIAANIATWSDAVIISAMLGPHFVTFYVIAARLILYTIQFLRSATDVLTPLVSATEAVGDHARLRRILVGATRYAAILVFPINLGLLFLGNAFLTLWLDAGHAATSYPVLVILCIPLTLQTALLSVASRILYGTGNLRWLSRFAVAQTILNVGISLGLVGTMGIRGVAIGTAVGFTAYALAAALLACRLLGVPAPRYLVTSLGPALILGAIPTMIWWSLGRVVEIDSWMKFLGVGAAGALAYGLAAQLSGWSPVIVNKGLRGVTLRPVPD